MLTPPSIADPGERPLPAAQEWRAQPQAELVRHFDNSPFVPFNGVALLGQPAAIQLIATALVLLASITVDFAVRRTGEIER